MRHLDWNVTARQGKPFVRRFVEERSLTLWLVLDVSASMRFGTEGRTKADRAAQAAALLATAAVHNGDRVGLLMVSDRIEVELVPAGGLRHLSQVVRALVATPTTSLKTQLGIGLSRVRRTARRAMIVVLSDFDSEEPIALWRRAARRHDTIAMRIVNNLEEKLPTTGLLALEEAETGKTQVIDSSSKRAACRLRPEGPGAQAGVSSLVRQRRGGWVYHVHRGRADPLPDRAILASFGPARCPLTQEKPKVLVPPRPNLGPEPWSVERPSQWPLVVAGLITAVLLAGLIWMIRRRRRGRPSVPPPQPVAFPDTPDAQLLSLAVQARESLATRFGPALRARTTEEISSDAVVKQGLGDEHFATLIRLLSTADHWKFASLPENGQTASLLEELPRWSTWQASLPDKTPARRIRNPK